MDFEQAVHFTSSGTLSRIFVKEFLSGTSERPIPYSSKNKLEMEILAVVVFENGQVSAVKLKEIAFITEENSATIEAQFKKQENAKL